MGVFAYYHSLNKVFEYIENNISSDLGLSVLSKIAGYSEFHFHRIFHSMTGKSIHDYVMERKLITAASRLLYDDVSSLTEIALDCGFSSSSCFSRGFKQYFQCSPSEYKHVKARARPVDFAKVVQRDFQPNDDYNNLFHIIKLMDIHVAGIGVVGLSEVWENPQIEQAYHRLFAWIRKNDLTNDSLKIIGVTLDTPEVQRISACRYYACAAVADPVEGEGEIVVRTFKTEGRYINFTIQRNQKNFADTFFDIADYLYGYYMPLKSLYPDNRPFVEYYEQQDGNIEITFCIPVK